MFKYCLISITWLHSFGEKFNLIKHRRQYHLHHYIIIIVIFIIVVIFSEEMIFLWFVPAVQLKLLDFDEHV